MAKKKAPKKRRRLARKEGKAPHRGSHDELVEQLREGLDVDPEVVMAMLNQALPELKKGITRAIEEGLDIRANGSPKAVAESQGAPEVPAEAQDATKAPGESETDLQVKDKLEALAAVLRANLEQRQAKEGEPYDNRAKGEAIRQKIAATLTSAFGEGAEGLLAQTPLARPGELRS